MTEITLLLYCKWSWTMFAIFFARRTEVNVWWGVVIKSTLTVFRAYLLRVWCTHERGGREGWTHREWTWNGRL